MTNAELIAKIRAEIERRQKENYKQAGSFAAGRVVEDADILSFLDTLQEPEVDFEEEADRMFFSLGWYEGDHHQPMLDCVSLEQFRGIARHFAKWGAEHLKK